VSLLKQWLAFPRPAQVSSPGLMHIVGNAQFRYSLPGSLPSGHAAATTAFVASWWLHLRHR
jgi:membrane-associated phospholipid phosphatase